jgi:hypothetical protein
LRTSGNETDRDSDNAQKKEAHVDAEKSENFSVAWYLKKFNICTDSIF